MNFVRASSNEEGDGVSVAQGLRSAMRRLPSGVALVALMGPEGPVGMASTSITSLSMDPSSILFCINETAGLFPFLVGGAVVGVSLLTGEQAEVSRVFGNSADRHRRFKTGSWSFEGGIPLLAHAEAHLKCEIDQLHRYGTHVIVIAKVSEVEVREQAAPLIYLDGSYL